MPSIRSILLFSLSISSICGAQNQAQPSNNVLTLEEAVELLPEESVRAALRDNLAPKYRDGVFEHGKKAIESIHNVDPQLATKVVDEAIQRELENQELKKRQNGTTSDSATPSSTQQGQSFTSAPSSVPSISASIRSRSVKDSSDTVEVERITSTLTGKNQPAKSTDQPQHSLTVLSGSSTSSQASSASITTSSGRMSEATPRTTNGHTVTSLSASRSGHLTNSASAGKAVISTTLTSLLITSEQRSQSIGHGSSTVGGGGGQSTTTDGGNGGQSSTNGGGSGQSSTAGGGNGQSTTGGGNGQSTTAGGNGQSTTAGGNGQSTTAGGNGQSTTAGGGGGQSSTAGGGGGQSTTAGGGGGASSTAGGNTGGGNTGGGNNGAGTTTTQGATTETGVLVPVTITTTDAAGNTVVQTTSAFQSTADTSTVVPVTTTNGQGKTITTSKTVPAVLVTTTNAQGNTITSASPVTTVKVAPGGSIVNNGGSNGNGGEYTTTDKFGNSVVISGTSSGQVITTTDAAGRTVVATYTPGGGDVSELVVKTTKLPNGQQSTITSFAVVGGATHGAVDQNPQKPGLQTALAAPTQQYLGAMAAVVGGAVGFAAML